MALRNEITVGANPKLNNLVMYRKVDDVPYLPNFRFVDDNTIDMDSNIEVRYIEYYKDADGSIIQDTLKHKNYFVPNNQTTYKTVKVVDVAQELYGVGEVITPEVIYEAGEVITPVVMDGEIEVTPAIIADGTEVKTPAVLGTGVELKVAEVSHNEEQVDQAEWLAATGWFMQLARTPITATSGALDSIEATLSVLPMDIPTGYRLQSPN
jgi:hypothetical protein